MKDAYVQLGRVTNGLERPFLGLSACFSLLLMLSLLLLLAKAADDIRTRRPTASASAQAVAGSVHETRDLAPVKASDSLSMPK